MCWWWNYERDLGTYFKAIKNPDDRFFQADEDVVFFNDRLLNSVTQIMFNELNIPFFRQTESVLILNSLVWVELEARIDY